MNNSKRIIRNTIFLYTKTIISTLVVFFSTRIVLNALGAEDYGVYGIVGGVIAMLGYINIAMSQATQRYMNFAEGKNDINQSISVFNNSFLLHFILGCIIVCILEILFFIMFNGVLNIPEDRISAAKLVYQFMVFSTFTTIITVPYEALINAHEDFFFYSIIGILDSILKLLSAFAIVWLAFDKLILYGAMMALVTIIFMLLMCIYCHKNYSECKFSRAICNTKTLEELGKFAGWNFVGVFASVAGNYGSTILMNHYFGTVVIAAKNIGDQIGGQLSILTSNLTKALNPAIMKSEGGGERDQMINLSFLACRFGFLLYAMFAIPFMFQTEYLLGLWLKTIPAWAVLFCQLQILRTLLEQLFSPLRTMLIAEGSVKQINVINLVLGILTFFVLLVLYIIGLPSYFHYVVSIVLMVLVEALLKIYCCKKYCHMSIIVFNRNVLYMSMIATIVCSIFCYVAASVLDARLHNLIIVSILVIISFISIITFGLTKEERRLILKYIQRK